MTRALAARVTPLIVIAVLGGVAIGAATFALRSWTLEDMRVYLDAAHRLREGDALYSTTNPLAAYQYAPWFAVVWIPLSLVPDGIVAVLWTAALVTASLVSVAPLLRRPTLASVAAVLLFLPILLFSSSRSGNVQPLIVAALVFGVDRRWGPVAIAAAASLKAFPLLFVLVYLGRREWKRFGIALILTLLLVAPMLLFDLARYTVDGPRQGTLYDFAPGLWAASLVGFAAGAVALARRRARQAWLIAATTVVVGLPRMLTYDLTFLLVGVAESGAMSSRASTASEDST